MTKRAQCRYLQRHDAKPVASSVLFSFKPLDTQNISPSSSQQHDPRQTAKVVVNQSNIPPLLPKLIVKLNGILVLTALLSKEVEVGSDDEIEVEIEVKDELWSPPQDLATFLPRLHFPSGSVKASIRKYTPSINPNRISQNKICSPMRRIFVFSFPAPCFPSAPCRGHAFSGSGAMVPTSKGGPHEPGSARTGCPAKYSSDSHVRECVVTAGLGGLGNSLPAVSAVMWSVD